MLYYYPAPQRYLRTSKEESDSRCPGWDPEGSSCFSCPQNIPEVLYKCLVRIDKRLDLKTSLVRLAQGFVDGQGLSSLVVSTFLKKLLHSFYK